MNDIVHEILHLWTCIYPTLEHKRSLKSLVYIYSNSQQYIVWVKFTAFSIMPQIIRILRSGSMKIFCTFSPLNISKLNFWLVICIAKNLIWTTLKVSFLILVAAILNKTCFRVAHMHHLHSDRDVCVSESRNSVYINIYSFCCIPSWRRWVWALSAHVEHPGSVLKLEKFISHYQWR